MKTELSRTGSSGEQLRAAIVVARWNHEFTSRLLEGAREGLSSSSVSDDNIDIFWVPGAFELPLACLRAAESGAYDVVIALGVVIRGDTPHFDYVAGQAAAGTTEASMKTGVPVLFGVITADTVVQVAARAGAGAENKGYEAAISAVEMAADLKEITDRAEQRREKALAGIVF